MKKIYMNQVDGVYSCDVSLSVKQWIDILKDSTITQEHYLKMLVDWYLEPNHAQSSKNMTDKYHPHHKNSPYNGYVKAYASSIMSKYDFCIIWDEKSNNEIYSYYPLIFDGYYDYDEKYKNTFFYWRLKKEIVEALYVSNYCNYFKVQNQMILDLEITSQLMNEPIGEGKNRYDDKTVKKSKPIEKNNQYLYPRNKESSRIALRKAEFKCEIDRNHYTFERKSDGKPYMEAHHLVPMCLQDSFEYSLDIPENIVSLCSNCHNEIHYGKNAKELIVTLYHQRKEFLKKKKIDIELSVLLHAYGIIE